MKNISVLGVTGSIGLQTLECIRNQRDELKLIAISANRDHKKLINIIEEFSPKYVSCFDENCYEEIAKYKETTGLKFELFIGQEGNIKICILDEIDIVVTAVVGMIGLVPTVEAIKHKKTIALANKETLVVGGKIIMSLAREVGVKILPVDSEHSAIFQCLMGNNKEEVYKILLTASGGPFRGYSLERLEHVTKEDALKHPNWNMGPKITIDSSTLMNKGLELIEAYWLYGISEENIEIVVHPQSKIHSMVEYVDGSVIAQISSPDMRLPIQFALNYPKRANRIINRINFYDIKELTFEKPDLNTFKCLKLAYEAIKEGGALPCILNGANEACVDLFLKDKITFLQIGNIIERALNKFENKESLQIEELIYIDKKVREYVYRIGG
ncbi:MAG: 1-deoxy-D-xylulose-5-phosphate reductoisomerase [Oscillospiraceae bacterium]|nr:1-deoxy-D-xylulose-5-phosphate reductoisomerase [Oscillospiraceae bacterium]